MIQAFTADRTDETLGVGVLPGGKDAATIKPGGGESFRVRGNEGRPPTYLVRTIPIPENRIICE